MKFPLPSSLVVQAVIILITAAAFLPMFTNPLIGDDVDFIVNRPFATQSQPVISILQGYNPPGHEGTYRPLKNLALYTATNLFGDQTVFYHLLSLLIHLVSALLVYRLTQTLTGSVIKAALATLLFSLHPLSVEAITWVTSSFDTLAFALILLVLYRVASSSMPASPRLAQPVFYLTLLAVFTYEFAVILPLLIALVGFHLKKNFVRPAVLASAVAIAVYLFVRAVIIAPVSRNPFPGSATLPLASQSLKNVALYGKQVVYPPPLSINHQLPYRVAAHTLYHLNQPSLQSMPLFDQYALGTLALIVLIILTSLVFKRLTLVSFSMLWFLVSLIPALPVVTRNPNLYAERYAYLAVIGFSLLVSELVVGLFHRFTATPLKIPLIVTALAYLSFLFILTNQRNYVWQSETGLFNDALASVTHHPMLLYQRGLSYQKINDANRAQISYLAAINQAPNFSYPYINLGYLAEQNGDASKAAALYQKAGQMEPATPLPWVNLAVLAADSGDPKQALLYLDQALLIDPGNVPAKTLQSALRQN